MSEIPSNHGQVLAQEPVTVAFDAPPRTRLQKLLYRILPAKVKKQRTFIVPAITPGNLVRVSDILLSIKSEGSIDAPLDLTYRMMHAHSRDLCRMVAIALTNTKAPPPESLVDDLYWNLSIKELQTLCLVVLRQMDTQSFLNTIVLMRGANVLDNGTPRSESPDPAMTSPQVPGNKLEA